MLSYNWLTNNAMNEGRLLYHSTPNMHMLFHIADIAKFLNPRFVRCFAFEDYMGDVVRSARACVPSTAMHKLGNKVVDNLLLLLHTRLAYGLL